MAILETKNIYETDFVPVCLTKSPAFIGTRVSFVTWTTNNKQKAIENFVIVPRELCNNNGYSTSEYEFCVRYFIDSDVQFCIINFGLGFYVKNNERWFLQGLVTSHSLGSCKYNTIVTDVSKIFLFITGNHSVESFDSYTAAEPSVLIEADLTFSDYENDDEADVSVNITYSSLDCGFPDRAAGLLNNGQKKKKIKWPWIAALYVDQDYVCTANFISRTRAVTAAHCLEGYPLEDDIKLRIFTDECKIS